MANLIFRHRVYYFLGEKYIYKKLIIANLTSGYITFGVPQWATGNQWDGDNILFVDLYVFLKDGSYYRGAGEFRNSPIGAGHAVYIPLNFNPTDLKKRTDENIDKFKIHLDCRVGNGPASPFFCNFRTEAVLTFDNGIRIASGYNDPAAAINNELHHIVDIWSIKPKYYDAPTLIEPIN